MRLTRAVYRHITNRTSLLIIWR